MESDKICKFFESQKYMLIDKSIKSYQMLKKNLLFIFLSQINILSL